jgi:hypothetical protein
MQKHRLIPVALLIALIFFASGLMYHLPERENCLPIQGVNFSSGNVTLQFVNGQDPHTEETIVTTLNTRPVLAESPLDLSEIFSDKYYGEGRELMHSVVKKSDILSRTTFRKTELEDESADEATETEVV